MTPKTIGLLFCLAAILPACNSNQSKENNIRETAQEVVTETEEKTPKGENLIAQQDCFACHNKTKKIIGPSYQQVADKYESTESNINMLADKIIKGGSGVWGETPMAQHPGLSHDDARAIAEYILSLRGT